jgi:predicted ATPase
MKLILQNIRCFSGKQTVPIYPLTILVGENSTGKTTCLASLSCFSDPRSLTSGEGFNTAPYRFGGYENIARFNPKTKTTARQFSIGLSIEEGEPEDFLDLSMTFKGEKGKIIPYKFNMVTDKGSLILSVKAGSLKVNMSAGLKKTIELEMKGLPIEQRGFNLGFIFYAITTDLQNRITDKKRTKAERELLEKIIEMLRTYPAIHNEVLSMAPIRTKPRRLYDVYTDEFKPEGDHLPIRLARFLQSNVSKSRKNEILKTLNEFGLESGLYDAIEVKRLGTYPSAPFQIIINIGGTPASLPNVGYSVSQSLPIVIQCILESTKVIFLQQQPEVHLHPRAQAALGSLFAKIVENTDAKIITETHSEYLLDRVRQEIANKNIDSKKVGILFFDKKGPDTKIHPLSLDDNGNILNAPKGYREFFIEEELRLLSRAK